MRQVHLLTVLHLIAVTGIAAGLPKDIDSSAHLRVSEKPQHVISNGAAAPPKHLVWILVCDCGMCLSVAAQQTMPNGLL